MPPELVKQVKVQDAAISELKGDCSLTPAEADRIERSVLRHPTECVTTVEITED